MKADLEFKVLNGGIKFLNFWNWWNGDDVVCKIVDGKIIDDNGQGKEISFEEFLRRVEEKMKDWPKEPRT